MSATAPKSIGLFWVDSIEKTQHLVALKNDSTKHRFFVYRLILAVIVIIIYKSKTAITK
jgi:hypothetical protein